MQRQQKQLSYRTLKKVWNLLPEERKTQAFTLVLMIIVGMFLEMLSVGFVFPALMVLIDKNASEKYPFLNHFSEDISNQNDITIIIVVIVALISIYAIKNLYLALVAWKQSKFIYGTQTNLAKKMLKNYMSMPYASHLQRNSSELINNLQVELSLFVAYMLNPGLLFIAESLVIVGLASLLLVFEPVGTLVVLAFFILAGGGFQLLTKKKIIKWGEERRYYEALRMKHAQQGLGAIKDIKLYDKEQFFLDRYVNYTTNSLKMNQRNSFVHNLTRLWLEVLAISGLCLLFIGMFYQGKPINEILPTMGLFAAVSFRLLPSVSRIISSSHQLRFGSAVTELMEKELMSEKGGECSEKLPKMSFKNEIVLNNIFFRYSSSNKFTLNNISLSIQKGTTVGFIGESGVGKSTLLDVILGLLEPTNGEISVDGEDVLSKRNQWQQLIGYVPQSIYLTDDTLKNNIAFGVAEEEIDEAAVHYAIKLAHIESLVTDLPDGLQTMLGERGVRLSGGQLQRVGIARALYRNPEILVLDEATSALDIETEASVMEAIDELHGEKTILIIAHRMSTIEGCDKVYQIGAGGKLMPG
jgi:ABC-type multidrug transport system fused ATPase/permease subunit